MKIVEDYNVIRRGPFPETEEWKRACRDVFDAVAAVVWPPGSKEFTIYPESGKKSGKGNGVKPIKLPCVWALERHGWKTEALPVIQNGILGTGDLDALYETANGDKVGFEWETGNISSSHRAVNKLALAMLKGGLRGGLLVLPSDKLKVFLTDRIGNIGELRPYFPLWESLPVDNAALKVVVVEHDAQSWDVEKIPKATDGRAKR
jgi:Restriction endonuclease BamHI